MKVKLFLCNKTKNINVLHKICDITFIFHIKSKQYIGVCLACIINLNV